MTTEEYKRCIEPYETALLYCEVVLGKDYMKYIKDARCEVYGETILEFERIYSRGTATFCNRLEVGLHGNVNAFEWMSKCTMYSVLDPQTTGRADINDMADFGVVLSRELLNRECDGVIRTLQDMCVERLRKERGIGDKD